jgi:hypothetical protein
VYLILDILNVFYQTLQRILSQTKNTEVEETSSYHNLCEWRFPRDLWLKSRDVLHLLMAISFLGLSDDQQNKFRLKAHKIAEKYDYMGQWFQVEEFLLLDNNAPGNILQWYLESHSVEDWFGDSLKRIIKIMKSGKVINPYLPLNGPVRYPQTKRGYDDKGSLPRFDKLRKEHYARPDKIKTEIPELNNTPFYPEWYNQEETNRQSHILGESHCPEHKGGKTK